jgi:uncharacterized protein (DUF2267 family)
VIEASELQDRDEWRAHTGDPVTQMNRNDFVGITQSSTSAIVQALYADFETTMATLRARLAPEENEEFCATVAKLVKDCLPKEQRVLLVQLRFSHENKKHNTTLNQLREILNVVNQHNKKKPGQPYVVRPLGTHVAGEQSQKLPLTKADLRAYKKILLPGFDLFGSLDEIDKRTYPVMSRRSLIAEFWRQIAETGRAALVGGRSGAVDIGAFMGVRSASWDEFVETRDHMRLCITHQIMGIIGCKSRSLDEEALSRFLAEEQTPVSWLENIKPSCGFRTVHRHTKRAKLKGASVARTMDDDNGGPRGWAILLYDDKAEPWKGGKEAKVFPREVSSSSPAVSSSSSAASSSSSSSHEERKRKRRARRS